LSQGSFLILALSQRRHGVVTAQEAARRAAVLPQEVPPTDGIVEVDSLRVVRRRIQTRHGFRRGARALQKHGDSLTKAHGPVELGEGGGWGPAFIGKHLLSGPGDDSGVEALRPERVDQLVRNGGAEEIPAEAEREIDVLSNPPPAGAEAHLRPVDVASVIPD